ncbi:hypothetical protein [Methylobacterium mesophilicum]|uniref:hypothetical protein n=1 Tax=Methylobacterium mesophilicum TaxID=39956 RepID=UPI002F308A85
MQAGDLGDLHAFAKDELERKARAEAYSEVDPFSTVPAGLLSSAEIEDYIRVTAMLDEFDGDCLKSASYEVMAAGAFIYWEGERRRKKELTAKDWYVTLPANSITFIQVRNYFRLPTYIAMRFNLRIAHVHRGLLLGTGPLVDPGFHGRLLIPLHNLTSSEYRIDLKKALIWVEFTKTTAGYQGFSDEEKNLLVPGKDRKVKQFPLSKRDVQPDDYLFRANGGRPILSSIPEATDSAKRDAKVAREAVENLQRWARGIGVLTVLGAVVGIASIVTATWTAIRTVDNDIDKARTLVYEGNKKLDAEAARTATLEALAARLEAAERGRETQAAQDRAVPGRVPQDPPRAAVDVERSLAELDARLRAAVSRIDALTASQAAATVSPPRPGSRRRTGNRGASPRPR